MDTSYVMVVSYRPKLDGVSSSWFPAKVQERCSTLPQSHPCRLQYHNEKLQGYSLTAFCPDDVPKQKTRHSASRTCLNSGIECLRIGCLAALDMEAYGGHAPRLILLRRVG